MSWRDLDKNSALIIDIILDITLHKGYEWNRVWNIIKQQINTIQLVLAKDSIYNEYILRGGEQYNEMNEYDSE